MHPGIMFENMGTVLSLIPPPNVQFAWAQKELAHMTSELKQQKDEL